MIHKKMLSLITILSFTLSLSAYYDQYGTWHPGIVDSAVQATKEASTNVLDAVTGGRYSDTPEDRKARLKAERKLEDKQKANKRKYQETEEKIRRKKEDRKISQME
jgi:hypothetical protein